MKVTKRDLKFETKGGIPFTVPAGTPVEPAHQWKLEDLFYVKPEAFPKDSIERHDATFYGLLVQAADVVE